MQSNGGTELTGKNGSTSRKPCPTISFSNTRLTELAKKQTAFGERQLPMGPKYFVFQTANQE
jgi:hypothetical protein